MAEELEHTIEEPGEGFTGDEPGDVPVTDGAGVNPEGAEPSRGDLYKTIQLTGMYESWFLDYASYVILERAVPDIKDGLKPVQRRILHAMEDLDDGRYNKVANIIGHTMKYHPHGDASIGDALVQLGQKELLVDTQGNWGNILTGDGAAAPRYIEARLSKFALEVVFNHKTTVWKSSYDGRNKEPVTLPAKFPLLLAMGVEGIAVGLSSKILPHNFCELIDASISILREDEFDIFPDFPTGGLVDISRYEAGERGGRVRIRARIIQPDKRTLVITEIPFGTTTGTVIDSIIAANEKGKIKIKKIDDNTAEKVEVVIQLPQGVSPDQTIDALYAFTSCEVTVSPNACVIDNGKPVFTDVRTILRRSTENTLALLRQELEIRLGELQEQWHFSSLEKIFIEKRIYRKIENCETWEAVLSTIAQGLDPYRKRFSRDITEDDIIRLTEIRIKRISRYNSFKADEIIRNIEAEMEEVRNHLEHLIDYAVNYFRQILKKYGTGQERKTEIRNFDTIEASMVAAATQKLYVNRSEGFAGTSLKKDEHVCDCSDLDDLIVFRADGTFLVTRVAPKTFLGHDIIHIDLFKKNDDRTIYNLIYRDGRKGAVRAKRFAVTSVVRDKEYNVTKGAQGTRVLYFSANPNGEAEVVKINLKPRSRMKKTSLECDFSQMEIRGRSAQGVTLTKYPVRNLLKREEGVSTLGARDIWFDESVKRLNAEGRGTLIGAFKSDDRILVIQHSGTCRLMTYDLTNHFDEDMVYIGKFDPEKVITVVYLESPSGLYYMKRFTIPGDEPAGKKISFIGEQADNQLLSFSLDARPRLLLKFAMTSRAREREDEVIPADEFIAVKSYRAKGKKLSVKPIVSVGFIEPEP
ncbi:MAG: DNA gyrase/topoisomerase IV subunit A, partial [Bacteroidales bacterium]|nr:DNA gyrase/topoisomerase IV subunit A [Bacteroidales bacterium]